MRPGDYFFFKKKKKWFAFFKFCNNLKLISQIGIGKQEKLINAIKIAK